MIDPTLLQIITVGFTFLSTVGIAVMVKVNLDTKAAAAKTSAAASSAAEDAASAAKEVKQTLVDSVATTKAATDQVQATLAQSNEANAATLAHISTLATATHTLVNSNFGASLRATLQALIAAARLTRMVPSIDPNEIIAADAAVVEAQRLLDDHLAKQAIVDSDKLTTG